MLFGELRQVVPSQDDVIRFPDWSHVCRFPDANAAKRLVKTDGRVITCNDRKSCSLVTTFLQIAGQCGHQKPSYAFSLAEWVDIDCVYFATITQFMR